MLPGETERNSNDYIQKIGKAAQNREKQEWAKEKPKLDNDRKLIGIYLLCSSRRQRTFANSQECKKIGKTCGSRWRAKGWA